DGFHADGGRFDPATNTWTALPASGAPSARGAHSAVWTGTEMIIWGGAAGADIGSGSRWNPTTGTWRPVSDFNAPFARRFYVAAWTGTEAISRRLRGLRQPRAPQRRAVCSRVHVRRRRAAIES